MYTSRAMQQQTLMAKTSLPSITSLQSSSVSYSSAAVARSNQQPAEQSRTATLLLLLCETAPPLISSGHHVCNRAKAVSHMPYVSLRTAQRRRGEGQNIYILHRSPLLSALISRGLK